MQYTNYQTLLMRMLSALGLFVLLVSLWASGKIIGIFLIDVFR